MIQSIFQNKVLWGLVLTFVIAGLGSIVGLVSPGVASLITLIITGLTAIGHTSNIVVGNTK